MATIRSRELTRKQMSFMNDPDERERARIALIPLDENKRPVSQNSVEALEHKQREDRLNERAIAAMIAQDVEIEETDEADSISNSTMLIKKVMLPTPSRFNRPEDKLNDNIPGIDQIPHELQDLCLDYQSDPAVPEEKLEKKIEKISYPRITFLGKNLAQRLHEAADDLLLGYGDKALALVTESPWVLSLQTEGSDRFGRCIKGRTLLQMAAMAGDVNLRDRKPEEKKDHGMVELLSQAGGLSHNEIADQLYPVLFSIDAKQANEARKKDVLNTCKEFAESLLKKKAALPANWNTINEFRAAQVQCKLEIDKFRKDLLRIIFNQTITAGYILDSSLIVELDQWFEDPNNLNRFGGWWSLISDIFWDSSYGTLQYVAAARDAQIHRHGIGRIVDEKELPARTLKNSKASSDEYDLCLMSSDTKPEKNKIYLEKTDDNFIAYTVITPKDKLVSKIRTTIAAPRDFDFHELNKLKSQIIEKTLIAGHAREVFGLDSKLGLDFYSGYYGRPGWLAGVRGGGVSCGHVAGKLMSSKNERVAMLCNKSIIRSHTLSA